MNNRASFVQSLFRQDCALCAATAASGPLCEPCLAELPAHDMPACPRCALPVPTGETCGACVKHPPRFDRTVAAFDYAYPVADMIHAFKYGANFALGRFLAERLAARVMAEAWPDLLLPMPLSRGRLKERGFNQALLIAQHLARITDLPVDSSALGKVRETAPQASLEWASRRANIKRAFAAHARLAGQRIALVDDVMTTGASVDAAAAALKKSGAAEVVVWVVARTL